MIAYQTNCKPPLLTSFTVLNGEFKLGIVGCVWRPKVNRLTIARIQNEIADYFSISVREMLSARRSREVARPRQIAMYMAKELTPKSLPDIGRRFGNRDHTTVIHAIKTIKRLMVIDGEMAEDIESLRERLAA